MDSSFLEPVKIFVGELNKYVIEFDNYGKKAFIVTGKSSATNGSLNDVTYILNKLGIIYVIFDSVMENPPLENVSDAALLGLDFGADFIIAIGGGSVIDAAKATSTLIAYSNTDASLLFDDMQNKHIPVLAVPTTAGTGSESTASAILTCHAKKTKVSIKRRIYCDKAFINYKYTLFLPEKITLSTSVDVLSHLIDGYTSAKSGIITDALAEWGFREFSEIISSLRQRQFDENFRRRILLMSTIAGFVISNTRTTLPHLLSYPLTYHKGVPHGFSCGILTHEFLKFHKDKKKIEYMLKLCGFENLNALGSFLKEVCPAIVCNEEDVLSYTSIVYSDKVRLQTHPFEVSYEDILNIYRKSLLSN